MKVGLFNGTVATTNGIYKISDIDKHRARKIIMREGFVSAIGHKSTAQALSDLISVDIPMNRINFKQEVGQKAIVIKLNKRPPEGIILNREEIEKIGYSLKLMERLN